MLSIEEAVKGRGEVVYRELSEGKIPNKNALIIIGDGHLNKVVESLETDRFCLEGTCPAIFPHIIFDSVNQPLDYAKLEYGVTVIRPHSVVRFSDLLDEAR